MNYILNSAVITSEGRYRYRHLSRAQAIEWLTSHEPIKTTISYQATCEAFELLLGVSLTPNREQVRMQPGEEALVFRLTQRPPEAMKGRLAVAAILADGAYEIGLLVREE